MAITFDPASLDFGEVIVNTQGARQLTLTNDENVGCQVVAPAAPFAMDPSGFVLPPNSSKTVVVTFKPTSAGSKSAKINAGMFSCSLNGTAVEKTGQTQEFTGPKKSLLLNVPDYSDGVFEQCRNPDAVQEIMTSFLRLGMFDYEAEPPKARDLLKVIHQAGPPGDPRLEHPANTTPPFDWDPEKDDFLTAPPFQARTTTKPATKAATGDCFFLDDTRTRDIDVNPNIADSSIVGHGLTKDQRQAESARLYSRGGWRDHSDGNRITTTYGDKVEVIRGNYKMVILGRQDDPGEAMGWDVGGSHVTDYAPGTMPGATFWHEWVPDYQFLDSDNVQRTGVWLLVNTTENVYQYARNAGNFREEKWGTLLETYIGSENPPPNDSSGVPTKIATNASNGSKGHEPPARISGVCYDYPGGTPAKWSTPPWEHDNKDVIRANPHIIEKTWARRIDSWTGSSNLDVGEIYEETHAGEIHGKTLATKIYDDTGSSSRRVSEIHEETWAKQTYETVDVSVRVESNTRAGSIFEATTAGTIWESTTSALHTELHVGPHVSIEFGAVLDMFFGFKFEFDLAGVAELSVFKHAELKSHEEKVNLVNANTALTKYIRSVMDDNVSVRHDRRALKSALTALNINFGV